ncbi:MAG: CDP-diacylglycerol--serine O-phosphatidyltransferase [Rhodospirillaceae bacterium]|jgi:CDP-diacylglycerol---serine O-phosphatidyltransferase|nr:CDP-diacylglycerol--serine O-phosphatidyltransferase [Rhodospirillaceae bacterium]MBT6204728.1 CDP-diacylglycerol--serine O-phosphatidyltransferase [Rhodospirillaceae bacterium]MBT6511680.1 CDP-diacylglycerol--serine O-phosphatidyltransferase [Rhodospirillaceae bacterium]MBT7614779.1 CDP-diacylglycerol--serine O-phosphatidyltransferase [Rhodospirillaceae bacterium]
MLRSRRRRLRRARRIPRLKGLTLGKLIPNIITVSAVCSGLTAIRFAIEARWELAVAAILLAAILDALDGRMARILNATSDFGAQLDSLADIVSFGVAPALVLYFWSLQTAGGLGWAVALFFIVCCGLRLARFNSLLGKLPPYARNYFTGVPAPAGGLIALLPIVLWLALDIELVSHPLVVGGWAIIMASLMVSRVPTFSFKTLKIPQPYVLPVLVLAALTFAGIAEWPWLSLTLIAVLYLATFPFSIRSFYRLKEEAERLHEDPDEEPDDDDDQSGEPEVVVHLPG